jgi:outer membrane biosynthesis protein TonB
MDRRSLIISVGLHVSIAVLAWIGLPSLKRDLPPEQPIVVMEIVQSVPTTNLIEGDKIKTAKQEQIAARTKKPPPPPPPLPAPPKARPPAPKPSMAKPMPKAPDPKAEILPQKVAPKPKLKPKIVQPPATSKPKVQQTAKQRVPRRVPQSPPKRVNELAQKKALQKQRTEALSGVMQNLVKAKAVAEDAEMKRREKERREAAEKLTNNLTVAAGNAIRALKKPTVGPIGLSEKAIVEQHVSKFWSPPAGLSNDGGLIVDIILSIDAKGNVLLAEVDESYSSTSSKRRRIMVEEAIRTIYKASPLPLPLEKAELWVGKETIFNFDPSKFVQ